MLVGFDHRSGIAPCPEGKTIRLWIRLYDVLGGVSNHIKQTGAVLDYPCDLFVYYALTMQSTGQTSLQRGASKCPMHSTQVTGLMT